MSNHTFTGFSGGDFWLNQGQSRWRLRCVKDDIEPYRSDAKRGALVFAEDPEGFIPREPSQITLEWTSNSVIFYDVFPVARNLKPLEVLKKDEETLFVYGQRRDYDS